MAEVKITISGEGSSATAALRAIRTEVQGLKADAGGSSSALGGLQASLGRVLETAAGFAVFNVAVAGIKGAFEAVSGSMIGFNSQMQNASMAFETMLGSADKAKSLLQELTQFAIATPFELPTLVNAGQKLLAFGFQAKDIIPILTAVGDQAATMGSITELGVNRIVLALGQIGAKGHVAGGELLQLTEAGVNGLQLLANGFGVTTGKMSDMVEKGLVPADKAIKILVDGMEGKAAGAMDKMSHSWTGATSNIKDALTQLTAGALKPFFDELTRVADKVATFLQTDEVKKFASDVALAMKTLSQALEAVFSGNGDLATKLFGDFAQQARPLLQQVEEALLQMGQAAMPAVEFIAQAFGTLIAGAVTWGSNLIISFASGMAEAASSVLSSVVNGILDSIAAVFESHSPPKEGPLKHIDVWGANLLTTFFQGMSNADFGALDKVMGAVKDAMTIAFSNGGGEKSDLIPRMIGSEAGVAAALEQIKNAGAIADETIQTIRDNVGGAADDIIGLIGNVGQLAGMDREIDRLTQAMHDWDTKLHAVDAQIDVVKRQIAAMGTHYAGLKKPLEDSIYLTDRFYTGLIKNIDVAVRKLDDQMRATAALRQPLFDQLTVEEQGLQRAVDGEALTTAENAHIVRRTALLKDEADARQGVTNAARGMTAANQSVTDAQQHVIDAQHRVDTANPKTTDAFELAALHRAVTDAQAGVGEAQYRVGEARRTQTEAQVKLDAASALLAKEGVQTNADLLAIAQARHTIATDDLAIANQQAEADKAALLVEKANLESAQTAATADARTELEKLNDEERTFTGMLQDSLTPLEAQRQSYQDARDLLDAQKQAIEDQRDPIQRVIDATTDRLGHEAAVADMLSQQLDLLNQQAAAAAGGAGKAGGGAGAAKPMGSVDLHNLGLNRADKPGTNPRDPHRGNLDIEEDPISDRLDKMVENIKTKFKKAVSDGFKEGFGDFTKQDAVFVGAGAIAGGLMGGPMGAAAAVLLVLAIEKKIKEHGGFKATVEASIDFVWSGTKKAGGGVTDFIGHVLEEIGGALTSYDWMHLGNDIVEGLEKGLGRAWEAFTGWLGDRIADFITSVKDSFGVHSPSTVFAEIGGDIVAGLLQGLIDHWQEILNTLGEWAAAFIAWVAPIIPALLDEAGQLGMALLGWMGTHAGAIIDALIAWTAAFVDWIGPAIPDLLIEAGKLGTKLLAWIVAQAPDVLTTLGEWAKAFVDWVSPQIQPLLDEGVKLFQALLDWITEPDRMALLGAAILKWSGKFVSWVATDVLPELPGALDKIITAIQTWWSSGGQTQVENEAKKIGWAVVNAINSGIREIGSTIGQTVLSFIPGGSLVGGSVGISSTVHVVQDGPKPTVQPKSWGDLGGGDGQQKGAGPTGGDDPGPLKGQQTTWSDAVGPTAIKDAVHPSASAVPVGTAALLGAWNDGPNGIKYRYTSPETYSVRYSDGRLSNFDIRDESGPLFKPHTDSLTASPSGTTVSKAAYEAWAKANGFMPADKPAAAPVWGAEAEVTTSHQSNAGITVEEVKSLLGVAGLVKSTVTEPGSQPVTNYGISADLAAVLTRLGITVDQLMEMLTHPGGAGNVGWLNEQTAQEKADRNPLNQEVAKANALALLDALSTDEDRQRFARALTASGDDMVKAAAMYTEQTEAAKAAAATHVVASTGQQAAAATQQTASATTQQAAAVQAGAATVTADAGIQFGEHIDNFGNIVNAMNEIRSAAPTPDGSGSEADRAAQLTMADRRRQWEAEHPGEGPAPFEMGGVTDGRLILTGEKGPEIGVLPAGTNIKSNTNSKDFLIQAARALKMPGFDAGGVVGGGMPAGEDSALLTGGNVTYVTNHNHYTINVPLAGATVYGIADLDKHIITAVEDRLRGRI